MCPIGTKLSALQSLLRSIMEFSQNTKGGLYMKENRLIADRLKFIRQERGLTTHQMAELFGVSEGHYRKLENGVYCMDIGKVILLYRFLGVDPLFLLVGKRRNNIPYRDEVEPDHRLVRVMQELFSYCKMNTVIETVPEIGAGQETVGSEGG